MEEREINIFWKKIVNTINDGLMFIGPEGTILMVNKAFVSLTGYSSKEAIGMSCQLLGCDACEQTLDTGIKSVWCKLFEPGQEDMKKCRCLLKRKDGSFLPVLKNASVLKDEDQNVLGVVETLTDISEIERLDEKVHILSRHCHLESDFFGMVGESREMESVFDMVRKTADSSAPVIILGESGTGKELVANAVHLCGARKEGPFIQLNCAALNASVLESEMFGHAKGAFTGAYNSRIGRFEAANKGDFFLDEIGDMPLSLQTKLLRVLESGRFERVGDISPIRADVRIITATNKNLEELIRKKEFRQDLFFRINVIPILIPPLRERKEDIPLLVNAFMDSLNQSGKKRVTGVSNDAMDLFMKYPWPGNVRELKNAMEYAFVTTDDSIIQPLHLPKNIIRSKESERSFSLPRQDRSPDEKKELIDALRQTNGNQTRAAQLLNINRVTVWNRMKKYGIDLKKILIS
ncbi:sigma-54 interaction domain-containing protein [Desulfospira joergensenii]|uniref:sigma-54 interaction domain-containing protein n=1 Tax=Desulfospira joergensenii TaxID=53329 RepID=UPI0003B6DE78|nr:sigma-54-dependent Fis family transcriptional regulator [Desulfospira joergensenii]